VDFVFKEKIMELVVARYHEDLSWLSNIPPQIRVTVYDKSGDKSAAGSTPGTPRALPLPNIGREAHTYLHHIVSRYETLAPLTIFCQGKPFDHAFDFHKMLRELASGKILIEDFFWLGHFADTDSPDGILFENWSKNPARETLDLNAFHRALFDCDGPQEYPFFGGAQFIATREKIRERPKNFYEHALQISIQFLHAAHCFERIWDKVFSAQNHTAARMNGEKTRYFKPVRRLKILTTNESE
jgi:hypothetical protein